MNDYIIRDGNNLDASLIVDRLVEYNLSKVPLKQEVSFLLKWRTQMDELLERAIKLARKYHENQFDKGGYPYIEHPLRVMEDVESMDEKVLAVLHDVLEDCNVSKDQLIKEGIPECLVEKLEILCKGKNEKYFDYIDRIKADQSTINVKLSDLRDNMNLQRLKQITEKDLKRLEKYKKAKEILEVYKRI